MADASNAIIAKARAIYGRRLLPEDFESLMHKSSVSGIAAYLKTTQMYSHSFADMNELQVHRGQLESAVHKNMFEIYARLRRFNVSSSNGFCGFLIRRIEIQQITNAIMFINAKSFDGVITYLPTYVMPYASFDLMALAGARSFDELIKAVEGTRYQRILRATLPHDGQKLDYERCKVALYTDYYKWLLNCCDKEFSGAKRTEVRQAVLRQAELDNLTVAYRMKANFDMPSEEIRRLMLPFNCRITGGAFTAMLDSPHADEEILEQLRKKYCAETELGKQNIELAVRKANYGYFHRLMSISTNGMLVMYALLSLLEIQRNNVVAVTEGTRYALSYVDIQRKIIV